MTDPARKEYERQLKKRRGDLRYLTPYALNQMLEYIEGPHPSSFPYFLREKVTRAMCQHFAEKEQADPDCPEPNTAYLYKCSNETIVSIGGGDILGNIPANDDFLFTETTYILNCVWRYCLSTRYGDWEQLPMQLVTNTSMSEEQTLAEFHDLREELGVDDVLNLIVDGVPMEDILA